MSMSWYGFFACSLSATPIDLHPFVFLLTEIPFLSRLSSLSSFFVTQTQVKKIMCNVVLKKYLSDNFNIFSSLATFRIRSTMSWCLMLTTDKQWLPNIACFSTSIFAGLQLFQQNVHRPYRSPFQCLRLQPHSTRVDVFLSVHHSQREQWLSERYSCVFVVRPGRYKLGSPVVLSSV